MFTWAFFCPTFLLRSSLEGSGWQAPERFVSSLADLGQEKHDDVTARPSFVGGNGQACKQRVGRPQAFQAFIFIYCTVFAKSAKLRTLPWPPAMRSIWNAQLHSLQGDYPRIGRRNPRCRAPNVRHDAKLRVRNIGDDVTGGVRIRESRLRWCGYLRSRSTCLNFLRRYLLVV
jgi:hypothetical protein